VALNTINQNQSTTLNEPTGTILKTIFV